MDPNVYDKRGRLRLPDIGQKCVIVDLAKRQDLNGLRGTVDGHYDRKEGRVPVKVQAPHSSESERVNVRYPTNLKLCWEESDPEWHDAESLQRSANNDNDADAQFRLGCAYDGGLRGFARDPARARRLYEQAANAGHLEAAYYLGCSLRDGEGGPVDAPEAGQWFRRAATQGHVQAATNLGILYMNGKDGVDCDYQEADKFLKMGAAAGDGVAFQKLQILECRRNGQEEPTLGHGFRFTPDGQVEEYWE